MRACLAGSASFLKVLWLVLSPSTVALGSRSTVAVETEKDMLLFLYTCMPRLTCKSQRAEC